MRKFESGGDEESKNIAFTDTFMNFTAILVVILMLHAAITVLKTIKATEEAQAKGTVENVFTVHMTWPPELPHDVDLWVLDANNVSVGYSNRSSQLVSLLDDHLGKGTSRSIREEFVLSTASKEDLDGYYAVNVQLYNVNDGSLPLTVHVDIEIREPRVGKPPSVTTVLARDVTFEYPKQELTVFRFEIRKGKFTKDSVSYDFIPIALRAQGSP